MADLAYFFHFQPSELWDMEIEELLLWHEQGVRINEQLKR
ncbi:MAG: GpE family phage tail protein [Proteobacteria bacterium]|nr:GpE family phage tail protein [Pseudomonadota bacterium]MBU4472142.1 GpE family phage tail protein [Pseudomonadota bacterium]